MTFLELMRSLEAHLGYHQLPLNPAAVGLKDIFESSPLHHDFMKRLTQSIYAGNRCQRLSDPIEREPTFDALAPLRVESLRSNRTDVDLFRTIEELCVALEEIFGGRVTESIGRTPMRPAQVIDIAPFRRRRLKTSA